jgi:hypothetical protein
MNDSSTVVAAIVGIDGSGKSSAWRGALERLAQTVDVVGIGDTVLAGAPGVAVHARNDLPFRRVAGAICRQARQTRRAWLYRRLKTLDLMARSRSRDHVVREEQPDVVLTDGDPLVNTLAWSVGRLYRDQLVGDDRRLLEALRYLAGEEHMPVDKLPYYLRHAWQLALVNRLGLARFARPDVVVLLRLDGAAAMERIRSRGRAFQLHESREALDAIGAGYERVCDLIATHDGVEVLRIPVARTDQQETARLVTQAVLGRLPPRPAPDLGDPAAPAGSGPASWPGPVGRFVSMSSTVTPRPR